MSLSLQNNINTNKVDVGYAARIQSDRIQNPDEMTCPLWTGQDLTGRPACAGSFLSKMEGCNSAEDRVFVENSLRPQYVNYVTLSAAGVSGDHMYDDRNKNNLLAAGAIAANTTRAVQLGSNPRFGIVNADRIKALTTGKGDVAAANAYAAQDADAVLSQNSRLRQNVVIGKQSQNRVDKQYNNIILANPNANVMGRHTASQGYMKLRSYP